MRQPSVLLIDYDSAVLKSLPHLISGNFPSLRVDPCSSRDHAEQRLRLKPYHGVIGNALLAAVDDFSLLHATRRLQPHASFIVTTGPKDAELASQAIERGSLDVIVTPPDPRPIGTTLQTALRLFQLRSMIRDREETLSWIRERRDALTRDRPERTSVTKLLEQRIQHMEQMLYSYEQTLKAVENSCRLLLGTAARLEQTSRLRAYAALQALNRGGRDATV
ncbi:MAG TPA: hypothetical protein VJ746_17850 [Nitrospira sp.]|nr:hypothetical protein [Nitrospira sp.]